MSEQHGEGRSSVKRLRRGICTVQQWDGRQLMEPALCRGMIERPMISIQRQDFDAKLITTGNSIAAVFTICWYEEGVVFFGNLAQTITQLNELWPERF
jgi:hypothetical protein